jgi:hypothetical protein
LGDRHKSSLPNEFVGRVKVIWAVTTPDFSEGYIFSSSLIITHHQPNLKDRWRMSCKQVRFYFLKGLTPIMQLRENELTTSNLPIHLF